MIIKASGRSALIAAAGLLVLLAGPAVATGGADSTAGVTPDGQIAAPATLHGTYRHAWHHRRHDAHHKSDAVAKADEDKTADDVRKPDAPEAATTASDNEPSADIPPSIANANARMLLAGINAAAAIPPGTDVPPPTTTDTVSADNGRVVVASDQLSDIDRALQEGSPSAATNTSPRRHPHRR